MFRFVEINMFHFSKQNIEQIQICFFFGGKKTKKNPDGVTVQDHEVSPGLSLAYAITQPKRCLGDFGVIRF